MQQRTMKQDNSYLRRIRWMPEAFWLRSCARVVPALVAVLALAACATATPSPGTAAGGDGPGAGAALEGIPVPELPPQGAAGPAAPGIDPAELMDAVERRKAQLAEDYAAREQAYRAEIRRLERELEELPGELAQRREELDASLVTTLESIRDGLYRQVAERREAALRSIAQTRDPAVFFTNLELLERLAAYEASLEANFSVGETGWYDPQLPAAGDPAAQAVELTEENAVAFMAYKWQLLREERYPDAAAASLQEVTAEVTRIFPDLPEGYYFASFTAADTIAALDQARSAADLAPANRAFGSRVSALTEELEGEFLEAVASADTARMDAIWEAIDVFAIRTAAAGGGTAGAFIYALENNLRSLEHMLGKLEAPRREGEAQRLLAAAVERRSDAAIPVTLAAGASLPQLRKETQTALDRALRIERRIRVTRIVQLAVGVPALGASIYSGIVGVRNYQEYQQADDYFTAFESRLSAQRASQILTVSGSLTLAALTPTPFVLRGDRGSDELRDTLNYIDRRIAAVEGGES